MIGILLLKNQVSGGVEMKQNWQWSNKVTSS